MIRMPQRSVTRFFIPLVDVMMLLFCIFLLMPNIRSRIPKEEDGTGEQSADSLREDKESLERELQRRTQELQRLENLARTQVDVERLKAELAKLRKEKIATLQQRLVIRVLEIDPNNGHLVFFETGLNPRRRVLTNQRVAEELIAEHRKQAHAANKELYYLFLFPRQDSAYPEQRQLEQYQQWFSGVAHGFDRPLG